VQEHIDYPEKLYGALDALRTNLATGLSTTATTIGNGFMCGATEYQDAVHAELQKFRNNSNKLLSKFSELVEATSIKVGNKSSVNNHNTVGTTSPDEDNPTMAKLFSDWVDESTMRKVSLETTYKPAIDLFIRFMSHLHGSEIRITDITVKDIRNC